MLIVDIDKEVQLGDEWMTRDDWDFLHNDPDLLIARIEENSDEFVEACGGWKELIKSMRWVD